jgi:cytoskeleton protein RodZ
LDPWIVEAIEANRFQALGAPVYAKGHLRKYATQLELSVDDIVARYDSLHDRPVLIDPIPNAMVSPLPAPRRSFKGIALTGIGLVAVAALTWVFIEVVVPRLNSRATPAVTAASASNAPGPAPTQTAATSGDAANTVVPSAAHESAPSVEAVPANEVETTSTPASMPTPAPTPTRAIAPVAAQVNEPMAAPAATPAAAEGALQVRLHFSGDSWTEIYDAQGARLMFAMGAAGRTRTISGMPPLQFTVGSVSAVSLEVNGEAVVIPRRDGRESSRFVIEADGNLR